MGTQNTEFIAVVAHSPVLRRRVRSGIYMESNTSGGPLATRYAIEEFMMPKMSDRREQRGNVMRSIARKCIT